MSDLYDEQKFCPICNEENYCQVNREGGCWCFHCLIPDRLLDAIQQDGKMTACICLQCILRFQKQNAIDRPADGIY